MKSYDIIITPDAEEDLKEVREYITSTLHEPHIALRYIQSIRKEIAKLSFLAKSIAPISEEPWHSRGLRKILAQNFFVYYRVDESLERVFVLNVVYAKRDQEEVLKEIDTDN